VRIIVDTREQATFSFTSFPCEVERGTPSTGDYSIACHETAAAIERKSLTDLIGCLTHGRDRFERELARDLYYELLRRFLSSVFRC
jgi:DNA excision repair protein ERCC-4